MFRPITFSEEERLDLIKNSMSFGIALEALQKCKSLEDFYHFSEKVKYGILSQMEFFILENYKKIPLETWNNKTFEIYTHNSGKKMLFGKKDKFESKWGNFKRFEELSKKRYNKAIKIKEISFTLDMHDGDFSVKFNNDYWSFLGEQEVVNYYYTIKNYLNEKV